MVEAAMGSSLSVAAVVIDRGDGGLCQWRWQGWTRGKGRRGRKGEGVPAAQRSPVATMRATTMAKAMAKATEMAMATETVRETARARGMARARVITSRQQQS